MTGFTIPSLSESNRTSIGRVASDRARGQSLIEFAVVLPVLMLLTLGMIDLGRAFTFGVGVQQATRESVRYASRQVVNSSVADSTILQRLVDASNPALQGCSAVQTQQTCGGGTWTFTVAITPPNSATTYSSITSALAAYPTLSGGQITVTASGSVALMSGMCTSGGLCLPGINVQGQSSMEFL